MVWERVAHIGPSLAGGGGWGRSGAGPIWRGSRLGLGARWRRGAHARRGPCGRGLALVLLPAQEDTARTATIPATGSMEKRLEGAREAGIHQIRRSGTHSRRRQARTCTAARDPAANSMAAVAPAEREGASEGEGEHEEEGEATGGGDQGLAEVVGGKTPIAGRGGAEELGGAAPTGCGRALLGAGAGQLGLHRWRIGPGRAATGWIWATEGPTKWGVGRIHGGR